MVTPRAQPNKLFLIEFSSTRLFNIRCRFQPLSGHTWTLAHRSAIGSEHRKALQLVARRNPVS